MAMMGRLEGKVAVITGGTSGIGQRTAERFVEEGAKVVVAGRSRERGRAVASALGSNAVYHRVDVRNESEIEATIGRAVEQFGRLDCLFNNAGVSVSGFSVEDVTGDALSEDVSVLLGGVLFGIKHVAPIMKRQSSGSIINTASIAGIRGGFGRLVYSAAKAAVIQLSSAVAMELADHRVRVNAISPGGILTPIFGRQFGMDDETAERNAPKFEKFLARIAPLGRAGSTDDVAHAAVFLASDESSFITGSNLVVDGGATAGRRTSELQESVRDLMSELGL